MVLFLASTVFAADSSDNINSMVRPGPHKPDPMLNTDMPAPPSAISTENMQSAGSVPPEVDPRLCQMLTKYRPGADVNVQPGMDAEGHAVAPADLADQPQMKLPEKLEIPLTINLAQTLHWNTSQYPFNTLGAGTEATLGTLAVEGDKVTFNGQPLTDEQQEKLAVLCMKQAGK